jgi:acyl carrier protein
MQNDELSADQIRSLLRLPPGSDISPTFEELGTDSWALIEFRAILETRFGLIFSDDDWLSLKCPNDVLRPK